MTAPVTPTGPFVVTHDRPHAKRPNCQHHEIHCPCVTLYREAFATLGDAKQAALDHGWPHADAAADLSDSGGRIELPDGSVIEVEATDDVDLAVQLGWEWVGVRETPEQTAVLVAAWNAEHGIGIGEAS